MVKLLRTKILPLSVESVAQQSRAVHGTEPLTVTTVGEWVQEPRYTVGLLFYSTWLWLYGWRDLFQNDTTGQTVINRKLLLGEVTDESLLGINMCNIFGCKILPSVNSVKFFQRKINQSTDSLIGSPASLLQKGSPEKEILK